MADRAASTFASPNGLPVATSSHPAAATDAAAAAAAAQGSMGIDGVSKALEWWERKAVEVDDKCHRLGVEGKRFAICTFLFCVFVFLFCAFFLLSQNLLCRFRVMSSLISVPTFRVLRRRDGYVVPQKVA